MTVEHYVVFVGAGAPLSEELTSIEDDSCNVRVVAPAVKKREKGNTKAAVRRASDMLFQELTNEESSSERARLYVWAYEPDSVEELRLVFDAFGHSSWIETVPSSYMNKLRPTRLYLQKRLGEIQPLLYEIAISTSSRRKSSPLILPLRNFNSDITKELKSFWYNQLDHVELAKRIRSLRNRYVQLKVRELNGYRDERSLIFRPSGDGECHGRPHPLGSDPKTFFCGMFRYGVSVFSGFHFDVTAEKSPTIQCNLVDPAGKVRAMRGEQKSYVNIFPNDYIHPEK